MSLEELLERARRVSQQAEVFRYYHKDTPVAFEANRLKRVEQRETSGTALRIVVNGRLGFSSTTDSKGEEGLIESALEMAPFGPEAHLSFPGHVSFQPVEVYDPATEALTPERMVELGQRLVDQVRALDPELLVDARVSRGIYRVSIRSSNGGVCDYRKSYFYVYAEGTLVNGTDMLFVWDGQGSCRPITDTSEIVATIAEQLERSRTVAPAPDGQPPVLFTPQAVASVLLPPLLAGINGRSVLRGASPLVQRLGEQALDQRFTLRDEPLTPYAVGSRAFDDEGVPTRSLPLVDKGVIASFLYDLDTAAKAGAESTGSAHRELATLPSPGASVLAVGTGDATWQDILSDMRDGLVVEHLLGAGQSNLIGGEFSANVLLGYRVQGGKIVGRVKNTLVSGNVYKVLKELRGLGTEARWISGSVVTPAIYCGGVSVSSKG
ncbi:MAG: TldD/PmbA family protein [Chloroflexota bacterium]|nr:TldD/PmbA family protein [Chloroflexota bacterium]